MDRSAESGGLNVIILMIVRYDFDLEICFWPCSSMKLKVKGRSANRFDEKKLK